ncbi:MAG TPA: hypothetical protein VKV38_15705 [Trebonia sp.]|jgi:hypothetical protein|nr:hypothetical protein [Trebonia sp.]
MSAAALIIMCAVIVVALAIWLVAVMLADRSTPFFRRSRQEPRRGRVVGGTHVGGGRSVAPRRDAPVVAGEDPHEPTVTAPLENPGEGEDLRAGEGEDLRESTEPDRESTGPDRAERSGTRPGGPLGL